MINTLPMIQAYNASAMFTLGNVCVGGFSVLCRDTIIIVEDGHYSGAYHQYCRGCSILYLCIIITVGDSVSTVTEVECH